MKVHIISPSGTNTENYITDKGDGTYRVEYTAFEDGRGIEKNIQLCQLTMLIDAVKGS